MNCENSNYLNFKNYLTIKDIKEFIKLEFTTEKAKYISKILKSYLVIVDNRLFVIDDNVIYNDAELDPKEYLKTNIKSLFETSLSKLNESERRLFELDNKREYESFKKESLTKEYLNDIILQLTNNKLKFNVTNPNEIHFINGYFDLEDLKFKPRVIGKHYITKYIRRNYFEPKHVSIEFINQNIINKIFPVKEEKDYILCNEIGGALSGRAIEDQTNFFMLGTGSSGKSLFMKCVKACIQCYMIELHSATFNKGNTKQDKIFNSFLINNLIRIAWVNEMDDKKMDEQLFKSFCEGVLQTVSLFVDGINDFNHTAKLIGTMNSLPNIKIDTGTVRRVEAHNPRSEFIDDPKLVNEKKNIYLKDKNILSKITNSDEFLNAFFKIIAEYAHIYITDRKRFKKPESLKEAEKEIIESNDIIGNFLNQNFEITENDNDQITSVCMYTLFKDKHPNSFIKSSQLVSELKQRKIGYNPNLRFEGGRGIYLRIKQKEIESPLDNAVNYNFGKSEEIKELKQENNLLKQQLEELKKQLELLQKPVVEIKQEKPKKTFTLEELEDKKPVKKVKVNKSIVKTVNKEHKEKIIDSLDIDDGYETDELEKQFSSIIKDLKKI